MPRWLPLLCIAGCTLISQALQLGECGDGVVNDDREECDDQNTADGDGCSSTCQSEISPGCGDGQLEAGEDCDGTNLGGQDCNTLGQGFIGGTLACDACQFDTSDCIPETCGNNSIEAGEDCDGINLNGESCFTQGFDGGTLACSAACQFNTT